MAQLTPGHAFQTGETVSPAKFHEYVDESFLVHVLPADCIAGLKPIYKTTPSVPATGDVRVGSDGRLEFYFGAAWVAQEAETVAITLTNGSGSDLLKGTVVVPKKTTMGQFTLTTVNRTTDVLGVLAADIADSASGLVYLRGRVQALVMCPAVPGYAAGDPLRGPDFDLSTAGFPLGARCFTRFDTLGAVLKSDTFATLLEAVSFATTPTLAWVRLGK